MKRMKWICRYGFLGLLLAGCAGWAVYCQIALTNLKKIAESLEYIDMAVSRPKEAVALLERMEKFASLRNWGFILAGVMLLCIGLLVTFQIVYPKIQAKPKAPKAPKPPKAPKAKPEKKPAAVVQQPVMQPVAQPAAVEQPAPQPAVAEQPAPAPASQPVVAPQPAPEPIPVSQPEPAPTPKPCYCHQCGTRYEVKPPFCGNCGAKL